MNPAPLEDARGPIPRFPRRTVDPATGCIPELSDEERIARSDALGRVLDLVASIPDETEGDRLYGEWAGRPSVVQPVHLGVRVTLEALALPEPGGGFSVVIPALPGCSTEGATIREAIKNTEEAAELWLAAAHDDNKERAVRAATEPFPGEGRRDDSARPA
jgi:antitoxin HicB